MNFLKKLGIILAKGTQLVLGLGPLVVPREHQGKLTIVTDKLAEVMQVVAWAEAAGNAIGVAGPEKARMAAPAISQIILSSLLVANRKIADPVLFAAASERLGGAVADVLNSLKDDVETENHD